jgi:galactokinase
MRDAVESAFQQVFGHTPVGIVRAPGRVNLIGEHTDYNDGFVMPMAVDRAVWMAFTPRSDRDILIYTLDFGNHTVQLSQDQLKDDTLPHWSRHVRGAYWLLAQEGLQLPGVTVVIGSDIPAVGGMSSSAAIGVASIELGLALIHQKRSQADKALLAVELEHQFMGMPCGVLDQMASAAAMAYSAMLLDCRTLEKQPVPLPDETRVVVMNTMKARTLVGSAYADRRRECEEAAKILGVPALRDATLEMIEENKEALGDLRYRRARHNVTENARVFAMKEALMARDLTRAGELLHASHASLRDDFEVSVRELDVMSEIAESHPGCYGARMMGGGFGGCAVGLVRKDVVEDFLAYVEPRYAEQTGLEPEFYVCQPAAGSSVEFFSE